MDILKKNEHLDFRAVYFVSKHLILCLMDSYKFSNIENAQVYLLIPSEHGDIIVQSWDVQFFWVQFWKIEHPKTEHQKIDTLSFENSTPYKILAVNFSLRYLQAQEGLWTEIQTHF